MKQILTQEIDKKSPKISTPSSTAPTRNDTHAALRRELLGMGFSEGQITEALFVTNGVGGVEAALNYILNNS